MLRNIVVRNNLLRTCFILSLLLFLCPGYSSAQDYEVYIARGIQLINEEKFSEALGSLQKAHSMMPDSLEANYYTGVAHSRLGNYKEAEELLLHSMQMGESDANVHFELGRLYYITSECDKSEVYLSKYKSMSDDTAVKEYASRLMETCGEEEAGEKKYYLNISVGGQHDTNVILEPTNPIVAADEDSDIRAIVYVSAGGEIIEAGAWKFIADYNFYQSFHDELDDFNIHYHKIKPSLELNVSEMFIPSVGYSFEHTHFGGDKYSRVHTYFGKLIVRESDRLSTEAIYEYRDNTYLDSDLFETNSDRSGYQHTFGLKQNFYGSRLAGDIYIFSDTDRAKRNYWSHSGYRIGAEIVYKVLSSLFLNVSGEYNRRMYKDEFPGFDESRLDRMQQYSARVTYLFSKRLSVSVADTYTINDSTLSVFDYDRNVAGVFITVGVL
jgi:tetratricopeptide (TPR) repeat protein